MLSTLQRLMPFFGFKTRRSTASNQKQDCSDTDCSEAWQTMTDTVECAECNQAKLDETNKAKSRIGLIKHFPFSSRSEFIVNEDISNGSERIRIPALSYKENDKAPSDYHYVAKYIEYLPMDVDRSFRTMSGCRCKGGSCDSGTCYCSSWHKPGTYYDSKGRLTRDYNVDSPQVIYECNAACSCNRKSCKNMVIQRGCLASVVLFKTKSRGWGIRTLENLRRGTFVGVYCGELISASDSVQREDDTYLFNLSSTDIYNSIPNNTDSSKLPNEEQVKQVVETQNQRDEQFVCDAKFYGNFTRFINHSCDPNVIGIRSFTDHHDSRFPYIAFFTNQDVQANSELTLNYGDNYWLVKCKRDNIYCLCKRSNCRFNKRTFPQTLKAYNKRKQKGSQN